MKNAILLIILLLNHHFILSSFTPEFNSNVVDFVKTSDKQELIKILNLIEEEQVKLTANKENHLIMCEKSLNSCRSKFNERMCDMHNESLKKELDESAKENQDNLTDKQDMMTKISLLVNQNKEDCKEIEAMFEVNDKKFESDISYLTSLLESVRIRATVLKEQEEEIIREENRQREERIVNERKKIEENLRKVQETENQIEKEKKQVKRLLKKLEEKERMRNANATNNQGEDNNRTVVVNEENNTVDINEIEGNNTVEVKQESEEITASTEQNVTETPSTSSEQIVTITPSNDTQSTDTTSTTSFIQSLKEPLNSFFVNKIKSNQLQSQGFLQIDQKQTQEPKNFFRSLFSNFAQVSQGLSLVQLSSQLQTEKAQDAINQLDSKLSNITDIRLKTEYLLTSQKDLVMLLDTLKEAKVELFSTFKESKSQCEERLENYKNNNAELRESYLKSKLEVENIKNKLNLYESQNVLCQISKENLATCNELSEYCNDYQIEFSEEIKELEDLMLYFKKYIDNY